ncbi:hypothetical protein [Dactylosporangium sp. CA-092794]|uniref:hypothetical protein n=1 Tax=Dactylosporangium sp. CA-092794 TaxID=3239929 RepID=UPI003D93D66A
MRMFVGTVRAALLLAVLVLVPAAPAGAAPVTPSSSAAAGKYCVVGTNPDGRPEYLFQIAARTLGDGNRYPEIMRLNAGRAQPDGGRLTDAVVLQPGWILLLPDDASGPGVRVGPPSPAPTTAPAGDTGGQWLVTGGVTAAALVLAAAAVFAWRRRTRSLYAVLASGDARVEVRLKSRDRRAFAWLGAGEAMRGARLPVSLGERGGRRLVADLARAPGVVTVHGPELASRRWTAHAVERLGPAAEVVVVRETVGRRPPAGSTPSPALPRLDGRDRPLVVLCDGWRDARELDWAWQLGAAPGTAVAIAIGPVLRGTWSVRVDTAVPTGRGQ